VKILSTFFNEKSGHSTLQNELHERFIIFDDVVDGARQTSACVVVPEKHRVGLR